MCVCVCVCCLAMGVMKCYCLVDNELFFAITYIIAKRNRFSSHRLSCKVVHFRTIDIMALFLTVCVEMCLLVILYTHDSSKAVSKARVKVIGSSSGGTKDSYL